MQDARLPIFADVLTGHSTNLQSGENVFIELYDVPQELGVALIRAVRKAGATPFVQLHSSLISREMMLEATEDQFGAIADIEMFRIEKAQAYIAIRGSHNINESSDVPADKLQLVSGKMRPVITRRVNDTKWVVCRWPTSAMAQQAGMSTEAFENFYFDVCTLDYGKMARAMEPLHQRMSATDRVHITGEGTDLHFSIKGQTCIPCSGEHNIPDGEVFTSPVIDSVNGHVSYNAPTIYRGVSFDNIRLEFTDGKITNATSNRTELLNKILDSDDGARYIGEFALGVNPHIREPMRDILFDEKIAGSFHFTPGQAYEKADNGNRSQVHWDMVCIQRPDYGGGEIRFDDELIRKDGQFVPQDLHPLNPENLM